MPNGEPSTVRNEGFYAKRLTLNGPNEGFYAKRLTLNGPNEGFYAKRRTLNAPNEGLCAKRLRLNGPRLSWNRGSPRKGPEAFKVIVL
jgi:hypothetical protein